MHYILLIALCVFSSTVPAEGTYIEVAKGRIKTHADWGFNDSTTEKFLHDKNHSISFGGGYKWEYAKVGVHYLGNYGEHLSTDTLSRNCDLTVSTDLYGVYGALVTPAVGPFRLWYGIWGLHARSTTWGEDPMGIFDAEKRVNHLSSEVGVDFTYKKVSVTYSMLNNVYLRESTVGDEYRHLYRFAIQYNF